jgi:hypothetical protein
MRPQAYRLDFIGNNYLERILAITAAVFSHVIRTYVDRMIRSAYRLAMEPGLFRRRTVALIAAYAVALQMLLPGFVPMASAADLAVICSHDRGDGSGQPARHDLPCAALCAAMAQAGAGPLPPDVVFAAVRPRLLTAVTPTSDWVSPQIAPAETQAPRGPPLG